MQMILFCTAMILSVVTVTASPENRNLSVQNISSQPLASEEPVKKTNVRLSPNPTSTGKIKVSSNVNEELHFYVFDLEGTLLHRITLDGKEEKTITNLKKGTYMYDVFKNDESIEQGKIIAK